MKESQEKKVKDYCNFECKARKENKDANKNQEALRN